MKPDWEIATKSGDAASLVIQIAAGADVDALDRYGQSALMIAATQGHLAAVRILLESGADLDRTAKYGLSATMLAVINNHEAIAHLLAEAGADLRLTGTGAPGFAGKSAADLALERGQHRLARVLSPPGSNVRQASRPRPRSAG